MVILSGIQTLGKLSAAAMTRQVTNPLEDLVGELLQIVPGINRLSAGAPAEGGGLNVRALSAQYAEWFRKQTWMDSYDVLMTGKGELDRLYGNKKNFLPPSAMEFFGRLHGTFKNPVKRAKFASALQKLTEWHMKQGIDTSDPMVQAVILSRAYVEANRDIFLQDNAAVKVWRSGLRQLRTYGAVGKIAATGAEVLNPIVKIPSNFVSELTDYAFGFVKGNLKILHESEYDPRKVFKEGVEKLSPEDKDYVFRCFKKNGLGLALFALGYVMSDYIGGYYQPGEKRKAGDVKWGRMRIVTPWGNLDVPSWMLHSPALEMMQLGATLHRTIKYYQEYNEQNDKKIKQGKKNAKEGPISAGFYAGAKGVAEETPFVGQAFKMAEGFRSRESFRNWANQFAESLLMPPDIRRISKYLDRAGDQQIPREQKEFWSQVMRGDIPGQRKNLPVDIAKVKKMQLDQLAEIMENAPGDVVDQIQPVFRTKFRRAHGLSDDERNRYLELIK